MPGQADVGDVSAQRQARGAPVLLPEVERLRETAHRPDGVVGPVVQLCRDGGDKSAPGIIRPSDAIRDTVRVPHIIDARQVATHRAFVMRALFTRVACVGVGFSGGFPGEVVRQVRRGEPLPGSELPRGWGAQEPPAPHTRGARGPAGTSDATFVPAQRFDRLAIEVMSPQRFAGASRTKMTPALLSGALCVLRGRARSEKTGATGTRARHSVDAPNTADQLGSGNWEVARSRTDSPRKTAIADIGLLPLIIHGQEHLLWAVVVHCYLSC